MNATSELATRTLARWESMKSTRFNWMLRWDDCARYISPRKGNILTKYTPGQDQTINLYDTTAEEALGIFAAGCLTHIVPAGEKWFRFEPKAKSPSAGLKDWLDQVSDIAIDVLVSSNFYLGIHEDFLDAGCFGTSCLLGDEGKKSALNFVNIPVGTFAIEEDDEGVVDTVPMVRYFMAGDLTDKHKAEFQKFIDFSTEVGTVPEKVDITKYLQAY